MEKKQFKGTQGKWIVEYYPTPLNQMMQANFGIKSDDGAKTPICKLPCSISDKQTELLINRQKADSQLIASAPELLKRLQSLMLSVMAHPDYFSGEEGDEWHDLISLSEETVNKALGI